MARARLRISAVLFAVLWTLGMVWWSWPLDVAGIVIFAVAGAAAGLLWYWAMGKWLQWQLNRQAGRKQ